MTWFVPVVGTKLKVYRARQKRSGNLTRAKLQYFTVDNISVTQRSKALTFERLLQQYCSKTFPETICIYTELRCACESGQFMDLTVNCIQDPSFLAVGFMFPIVQALSCTKYKYGRRNATRGAKNDTLAQVAEDHLIESAILQAKLEK